MALSRVLAWLAISIGAATPPITAHRLEQAVQQTSGSEVWVNPGVGAPAPTNLSLFLAKTTVAFAGTLERISPEFLDANDPRSLATRLVFRPTEVLKGAHHAGGTIDVWTSGGTYVETPTGRRPHRPAEIAESLPIGALFFVAATVDPRGPDPILWLTARESLVQMDGERVTPAARSQRWVSAVIARERSQSPTLRAASDDRATFMAAIRKAARQ